MVNVGNVRMGKVLISDRLDMLDIDNLTQDPGIDNLFDRSIVWRVPKDYRSASV